MAIELSVGQCTLFAYGRRFGETYNTAWSGADEDDSVAVLQA
jgi:hypothetical protein